MFVLLMRERDTAVCQTDSGRVCGEDLAEEEQPLLNSTVTFRSSGLLQFTHQYLLSVSVLFPVLCVV